VFTELLSGNVLIKSVKKFTGTSLQVFGIHSTNTETDALFILHIAVFIQSGIIVFSDIDA
jgi:hypothetical protein